MTTEYEVFVKLKPDGGYFTARAMIHAIGSSDSQPLGASCDCTSLTPERAISYALTELATLIDRGAIKLT